MDASLKFRTCQQFSQPTWVQSETSLMKDCRRANLTAHGFMKINGSDTSAAISRAAKPQVIHCEFSHSSRCGLADLYFLISHKKLNKSKIKFCSFCFEALSMSFCRNFSLFFESSWSQNGLKSGGLTWDLILSSLWNSSASFSLFAFRSLNIKIRECFLPLTMWPHVLAG